MRSKTALVITMSLITTTSLMATSAYAGGGQWIFEGTDGSADPAFVAGQHVRASATLWLEGVNDDEVYWAGPQHGPFLTYVVPRKGVEWGPYPPPLPEDAIRVGEVVFGEERDPGIVDVTLEFVVPEVEPGYYSLLYCNDPCTRQIGDIMTTAFTVVEDAGQAFLAGRIDRLHRRLTALPYRLKANLRNDIRVPDRRLERRVEMLEQRIGSLLERPIALGHPSSNPSAVSSIALPALALGCLALLGDQAARFVRRRRVRALRTEPTVTG